MLIDTHAHIFYDDYKEDREEVLKRASDSGVEQIVVPGTTLETSREAVELSEKYHFVFASVGYHPHDASNASDTALQEIEALSHHRRVVAIGEIGLDYHYDFSPREVQQRVFADQIGLAMQRNLPIIVHTRESVNDAINSVRKGVDANPAWCLDGSRGRRGVFHCFSGNADEAGELFGLGFYVSYPGIVTFKNSPVVETLRAIGVENVLIETDSPYMTPVPHRGKRNEPAYVRLIAERMAEILNIPFEQIAEKTTENARTLFNLS